MAEANLVLFPSSAPSMPSSAAATLPHLIDGLRQLSLSTTPIVSSSTSPVAAAGGGTATVVVAAVTSKITTTAPAVVTPQQHPHNFTHSGGSGGCTVHGRGSGSLRDILWACQNVKGRAFKNENTHVVQHISLDTCGGTGGTGTSASVGVGDGGRDERFVFGVFDGHGGRSAAVFCRENFINFIVAQPEFHCLRHLVSPTTAASAARSISPLLSGGGAVEGAPLLPPVDSTEPAPCRESGAHDRSGGDGCGGDGDGNGDGDAKYASVVSAGDDCGSSSSSSASSSASSDVARSLANAFLACDTAYLESDLAAEQRRGKRSPYSKGCAALVVVVEHGWLTVGNAGDCRAVLWCVPVEWWRGGC
jgi:hypothetical protein